MSEVNRGLLTGSGPTFGGNNGKQQKASNWLEDSDSEEGHQTPSQYAIDDGTDEVSAIEQRATFEGVVFDNDHPPAKPKLEANAEFAAEMHRRDAEEKAAREKKRQEEEAKKAKEEEEHEKEIEAKLQEAQELDPEIIEDELKEQTFAENREKLYPDAIPVASETEERIWEKRADKGASMTGRGKLEFVFDTKLRNTIFTAIGLEFLGAILTVVGVIIGKDNTFIERLLIVIGLALNIAAIIIITIKAHQTKHHEIPSEYTRKFVYATVIPGAIFRLPFIIAASQLPIVGQILGPMIGCAVAASIHYSYINSFGITVSLKDTIINTLAVMAFYSLSFIDGVESANSAPTAMISAAAIVIGTFFGDRLAILFAYKSAM